MLGMKLHVFSWLFFGEFAANRQFFMFSEHFNIHELASSSISPAVQREISAVLRLKGTENEQLNFTCSHSWATTNVKYFCRLECRDKDVLIRSVGLGKIAKKGRYALYDRGPQFTVTIKRLMKSDKGKYWCGVERSGIDTYQDVILKVLDGKNSSLDNI